MIRIDCRKKVVEKNVTSCDSVLSQVEENANDISLLFWLLSEKSCVDANFADMSYGAHVELLERVNLLAKHIGLEFIIEPEVPAIPAKLVLKKIAKKSTKKVAKKVVKKAVKKVAKKK